MFKQLLPSLEMVHQIYARLSPEDILAMASTSKYFSSIQKDNRLWENKLRLHFPGRYAAIPEGDIAAGDINWYTTFFSIYKKEYRGLPLRVRKILSYIKEQDIKGLQTVGIVSVELTTRHHQGWAPIHFAASRGNVEVLIALHCLGADLTMSTNDGATPAFIAAAKGHVAILTELHRLGANLSAPANDGATPAYIAAQNGHVAVLTELHRLGADLTEPTNDGETPAFFAAQEGHVAVLTELHRLGADLTSPNYRGLTLMDIAAEMGYEEVVAELQRLAISVVSESTCLPMC